jgi:hypothetical protein
LRGLKNNIGRNNWTVIRWSSLLILSVTKEGEYGHQWVEQFHLFVLRVQWKKWNGNHAGGGTSENLRAQLKLTKKQFYSRISRLIKIGLVKRQKGNYFVTAFGRVIYGARRLLRDALKNYWKLNAIVSLGVAQESDMPEVERTKIIDLMIGNQQIKEILLSKS